MRCYYHGKLRYWFADVVGDYVWMTIVVEILVFITGLAGFFLSVIMTH